MAYPHSGIEYLDPNRQWLPQVAVSSVTKLHHTASRTLLTQTFINPSSVSPIPSAQYTFPLYESCAIVAFRCYVGRRLIEGIIKEKDDASATFQAAVNRNEPASLLEQHTADVFSTSIGNVPAGETVKVEIEYIMELKHDAEVDGLRFTIPTSIAPRYGAPPTGMSKRGASRAFTAKNMNISVEINMPGSIQSIESPSHTISLRFGGQSPNDPDASNPQHALVTLSQTTTELGKDFILLIKCASLSSPAALLEEHPAIPNSCALMVTLVPRFNLPRSTRPEVVFIIDRSGSMSSRVAPLKSSLSVFLKSLPVDISFNICSFGSHHSFLWERSRPYNSQTFSEAQEHCNSMQANFGGTEILPAVKSAIQRRLIGLNLEIMLLTDGEVWNSEVLFKYVEQETEKGDVRLFSLGIGRDVSHALIDGLARVGRGFSQVVSDEREGMEGKVTRMLRGGLSAHIVNYRLEWEGKPSPEEVNLRSLSPATSATHRISLFDSHANSDSPVSFSDSPQFTIRTVIQAPYKIRPLFPFSRSTVYALVSSNAHPPSHVFLRGTTPEGDELEVEIAVQRVPMQGETVHQLAARKILQELKDGTSYVHGAVDKERQPALLAKWVQKEGVRVGLKYEVASHWTSFVAVERKEVEVVKEVDVEEMEVDEDEDQGWRDQRAVDVSPPSAPDGDEDLIMEAEHINNDGIHRHGPPASPFGPQVVGGTSFPAMMMMVAPPNPASIRSRQSNTRRQDSSAAPISEYSKSLASNDDSTFYSYQGSVSSDPNLLIGDNPTGKGPEGESVDKPAKQSFWSSLKQSMPLRIDRSSSRQFNALGSRFAPNPKQSYAQQPTTWKQDRYLDFSSPDSDDSHASAVSNMHSLHHQNATPLGRSALLAQTASNHDPPAGSTPDITGQKTHSSAFLHLFTNRRDEYGFAGRSLHNPLSDVGDEPNISLLKCGDPGIASEVSSAVLEEFRRSSVGASMEETFSTPDIGILYLPPSSPPLERVFADTGAQPLSPRTKTLIDLQTFEGCFVLDSALAALLGVSLSDLEAKLISSVPANPGLGLDCRKTVWATILAIKLFETQLAGERSVWQLVVDKARAWIAGVGVEDIAQFEKMAGEILRV